MSRPSLCLQESFTSSPRSQKLSNGNQGEEKQIYVHCQELQLPHVGLLQTQRPKSSRTRQVW